MNTFGNEALIDEFKANLSHEELRTASITPTIPVESNYQDLINSIFNDYDRQSNLRFK